MPDDILKQKPPDARLFFEINAGAAAQVEPYVGSAGEDVPAPTDDISDSFLNTRKDESPNEALFLKQFNQWKAEQPGEAPIQTEEEPPVLKEGEEAPPITEIEMLQSGFPTLPESRQQELGKFGLDQLAAGRTLEDIQAEEQGLGIPYYDPIDLAIDVGTGFMASQSKIAMKGIKEAWKAGNKALYLREVRRLSKTVGLDVGFGAAAGGTMAIAAEVFDAGPLVQMLSGVIGPVGTSTLLTLGRKRLAQWMSTIKVSNPEIHAKVQEAARVHPDSELSQGLLATAEAEITVKPGEGAAEGLETFRVSRIDVAAPDATKPQGAFFSVVSEGFESPHAETVGKEPGAQVFEGEIIPRNPLTITGDVGEFDSAGISALRQILPEEFEELKRIGGIGEFADNLRGTLQGRNDLMAVLREQYPGVAWERYSDPREMLEGLAGIKARELGYDAIIHIDQKDPNFSELVVLDQNLLAPPPPQMTPTLQTLRDISDPDAPLANIVADVRTTGDPVAAAEYEAVVRALLGDNAWGDLDGMAVNINLSKFETTDDIRHLIKAVADAQAGRLDKARRGLRTNEVTEAAADDLGLTVDQFLSRQAGQALNAEEIWAAHTLHVSATLHLKQLAREVVLTDSKAARYALQEFMPAYTAIVAQVSGTAAEAGRALQIFKKMRAATPQSSRQMDEFLKQMDRNISTTELAGMIDDLDTPGKITPFVVKVSKAKTFDKIFELWINALLSNPATQVVNIGSNALVALWQIPERYLAVVIGRGLKAVGGTQEITVRETNQYLYGLIRGARDGFGMAAKAVRQGRGSDVYTKLDVRYDKAIDLSKGGLFSRFVDGLIHAPTTALMSADEFFKSVGYAAESQALAYRRALEEGLTNPDDIARRQYQILQDIRDGKAVALEDIKDDAIASARHGTFTDPLIGGKVRGFVGGVSKSMNKHIPELRLLAPFIRTPTNIVLFAAERTPLGLLSRDTLAAIRGGGAPRDLALARMSMGTVAMLVVSEMAAAGIITGDGPVDRDLRRIKMNTGWKPWSIKIGDTYFSYNRIEPLGMLLGWAASFTEIAQQAGEEEADKLAAAIVLALSATVTSKTWMRSFSEFIEAQNDPERYGQRFVNSYVGTLIPSGGAQVARITDPTYRRTEVGDSGSPIRNEVNEMINVLKSRMLGYSEDLPPAQNLWGEPIVMDLTGFIPLDLINPIYQSKEKWDPASEEILRLRVPIKMPGKTIEGVKLHPWEYHQYVTLAGSTLEDPFSGTKGAKKAIEKLMKQSNYKKLSDGPDGGKAWMIRKVINRYRELARAQVVRDNPDLDKVISLKRLEGR